MKLSGPMACGIWRLPVVLGSIAVVTSQPNGLAQITAMNAKASAVSGEVRL